MGLWTITSQNVIAQADDPGAVGAGVLWTDTNANLTYRRNDANDGWNVVGSDTAVSAAEYAYLDGVTSAIQTQLNTLTTAAAAKLDTLTATNTILTGGDFSTASTTYVDITSLTITLTNVSGGKAFLAFNLGWFTDTGNADTTFALLDNASAQQEIIGDGLVASQNLHMSLYHVAATSGQVIKLQMKVSAGNSTISKTDGRESSIHCLEIST